MLKEKLERKNLRGSEYRCGRRGGSDRSSEETSVMEVEREGAELSNLIYESTSNGRSLWIRQSRLV